MIRWMARVCRAIAPWVVIASGVSLVVYAVTHPAMWALFGSLMGGSAIALGVIELSDRHEASR